jgi:hypothetical protein
MVCHASSPFSSCHRRSTTKSYTATMQMISSATSLRFVLHSLQMSKPPCPNWVATTCRLAHNQTNPLAQTKPLFFSQAQKATDMSTKTQLTCHCRQRQHHQLNHTTRPVPHTPRPLPSIIVTPGPALWSSRMRPRTTALCCGLQGMFLRITDLLSRKWSDSVCCQSGHSSN